MTSHFPAHRRVDYGSVLLSFFECLPLAIVAFLGVMWDGRCGLVGGGGRRKIEKPQARCKQQSSSCILCWRLKAKMSFPLWIISLGILLLAHLIAFCVRANAIFSLLMPSCAANESKYSKPTRNPINKLFSISRMCRLRASFEKLAIVSRSLGKMSSGISLSFMPAILLSFDIKSL